MVFHAYFEKGPRGLEELGLGYVATVRIVAAIVCL